MKLHILAIGVHPDDVELGCTGTLINHIRKGQKVGILDLTQGELGSRGTIETRNEEAIASAKLLGVSIRENLKMADGFFQNDKAHQLQIIEVLRKYQPDIILANSLSDRHPDHGKAGRLIADACFLSGLRKIETSADGIIQQHWRPKKIFHYIQDRFTEPDFIVDISDSFELKTAAIKCFKTQFFNDGSPDPQTYISAPGFMEKIENRASQIGHRIGAKYGEGFKLETSLGVKDLDAFQYPDLV